MCLSEKLRYGEIEPMTRAALEAAFASSDANRICEALYSAAHHEADWLWSQAQCLKMLNHESLQVRSSALMALSEIGIFRGHLDLETVLPEIQRFASDPDLSPIVEDALGTIRVYKLRQQQLQ